MWSRITVFTLPPNWGIWLFSWNGQSTLNFSLAKGFCSTYLKFSGHRKLMFGCTVPKIYCDQNKTTEDNDIAMGFIGFDWLLQGYTNNGSHSKFNADCCFTFISMILHNRKVKFFLYMFRKFQVFATKTFGVREVQSWTRILTVKIGYTLCVKSRFWVLFWNTW